MGGVWSRISDCWTRVVSRRNAEPIEHSSLLETGQGQTTPILTSNRNHTNNNNNNQNQHQRQSDVPQSTIPDLDTINMTESEKAKRSIDLLRKFEKENEQADKKVPTNHDLYNSLDARVQQSINYDTEAFWGVVKVELMINNLTFAQAQKVIQGQPAGSYLLRPSSQLKGSPWIEKKRKVLVIKQSRPPEISLLDIIRILKGSHQQKDWPEWISVEEQTVQLYAISLTGKTTRGISHVRTVFHDAFSGNLQRGEKGKFYFFAVHGGTDLDLEIPNFNTANLYASREEGFWTIGMQIFRSSLPATTSIRNINTEAILETYSGAHADQYVPFIQIGKARTDDRYTKFED